jgi:hypothetical protein
VTQERDPRDWVLKAGQSAVLERDGLTVIYAFEDALILSGAACQVASVGDAQATRHSERACA